MEDSVSSLLGIVPGAFPHAFSRVFLLFVRAFSRFHFFRGEFLVFFLVFIVWVALPLVSCHNFLIS